MSEEHWKRIQKTGGNINIKHKQQDNGGSSTMSEYIQNNGLDTGLVFYPVH